MADVRRRLAAAHAASAAPPAKAQAKLDAQHKLYVRDRIALLFDEGIVRRGRPLANALAAGLPADGVVTGRGTVDGRPAIVIANDPTVKAGSWGARTVEKIVRATEMALREELPVFWLVDSAGARITDQVELFPGRRGAGRIFHNQVALSGKVPQICCLFGPSAAGGAYIPAFCDIVIMVEGNASMYLGSPRMAEMVVGEKVTLEEMGGARMHCTVSGLRRPPRRRRRRRDRAGASCYFSYLPGSWRDRAADRTRPRRRRAPLTRGTVPERESQPFDIHEVIDGLRRRRLVLRDQAAVRRRARHRVRPARRRDRRHRGQQLGGQGRRAVRRQRRQGGPLHLAVRRVQRSRCVYLADVPGFMIGSEVERGGIIRHGAKMITAVSEATVPQFS